MNTRIAASSRPSEPCERHREQPPRRQQDHHHLYRADPHIGRDLADHDLERARRHRQQVLHGAALDLAGERHGGHHHQRELQDHPEQPGHDVVLGDVLRVVEPVDEDLEAGVLLPGRLGLGAELAGERLGRDPVEDADRRARCRRVAGVGLDQDLRPSPRPTRAAKSPGMVTTKATAPLSIRPSPSTALPTVFTNR
jgi:hypothetical protein